jgi:LytS/YehU family sensor histidine kinase
LVGLVAGYWYYSAIGCASGSCSITSNPVNSTLYGGLIGGLIGSFFEKKRTK